MENIPDGLKMLKKPKHRVLLVGEEQGGSATLRGCPAFGAEAMSGWQHCLLFCLPPSKCIRQGPRSTQNVLSNLDFAPASR